MPRRAEPVVSAKYLTDKGCWNLFIALVSPLHQILAETSTNCGSPDEGTQAFCASFWSDPGGGGRNNPSLSGNGTAAYRRWQEQTRTGENDLWYVAGTLSLCR